MRKRRIYIPVVLAAIAALAAGSYALAQGGDHFQGNPMIGFFEVPAVSTNASGKFQARVSSDESALQWELSYQGLEGAVQQAHIHFAQRDVNGGISVWLCSNLPSPPTPPGVQACPAPPATITGIATAANVVGPTAQGIAAGEFAELLRAMRAGRTYANVHSDKFPGGEIRAQIRTARS